jgi:hypothetical protein
MDCVCPKPTALTTVERVTCRESLGQIQRFIFQRPGFHFDADADPTKDITLLASWTPLWVAAGDTKIVSTPLLENVIIPKPEKISEGGGDNTTIDGREIVLGAGAITATGSLAEVPGKIIKQLKALMCEELVAFGVNQFGKIIGIANDLATPADDVIGIPVYTLWVSDAGNDGLNTRDKADISFALDYGWRDDLVIVTPAFNAKTQLLPPLV